MQMTYLQCALFIANGKEATIWRNPHTKNTCSSGRCHSRDIPNSGIPIEDARVVAVGKSRHVGARDNDERVCKIGKLFIYIGE